MRLSDHVALITGSTRGIGRATAEMFAAEGARVVVTGRSRDDGVEVEKAIRGAGGEAVYVPTDVGREEDVQAAVAETVRAYGKLTILVNNAAPTDLARPGGLDNVVTEVTTDGWERIMRVSLTGAMWCAKYAMPEMAKAGGGAVLNVSSGAGVLGVAGLATYSAAKGALISLTRAMAVEGAPQGIRANCVVVGFVPHGAITDAWLADPVMGPAVRSIHLTRLGKVEDVAYAALYLCSDEAAFVTGAIVPVDGGLTCKLQVPNIQTAPTG